MSWKDTRDTIFGGVVMVTLLLLCGLVAVFAVKGGVWLGKIVLPWLFAASLITLGVVVVIFGPMTIFVKSRGAAAIGLLVCSYVFGATLWFLGLIFSYLAWGIAAVIVGLVLMGGGVVPIAMLAAMFKGEWPTFWMLLGLVVLTFGTRAFALWAARSADEAMATSDFD